MTQEKQPEGQTTPNPAEVNVEQMKTQVEDMQKKLETITRQYDGSSKEALKLKAERDELAKKVSALEEKVNSQTTNDSMQELWERDPLRVVEKTVQTQIQGLQKQIESLLNGQAQSAYERFRAQHPGLSGELETKFDTKLKQLRPIYSDVAEAMQDAYRLIGGLEADNRASEEAKKAEEARQAEEKANKEKERATQEAGSANPGDRQAASTNATELRSKLTKLEKKVYQMSLLGQEDISLRVEIARLKKELAAVSAT